MSLESMLAALTPQEKLDAMNILWRNLSANPGGRSLARMARRCFGGED